MDKLQQIQEAAQPLATYLAFVEAGRELDGDDPLADGEYLLYYSGNGGSAGVRTGQIRKLLELIYG